MVEMTETPGGRMTTEVRMILVDGSSVGVIYDDAIREEVVRRWNRELDRPRAELVALLERVVSEVPLAMYGFFGLKQDIDAVLAKEDGK